MKWSTAYFDGIAITIKDYDPSVHFGKLKTIDDDPLIYRKKGKRKAHFALKPDEKTLGLTGMGDWHKWWQNRIKKEFCEIMYPNFTGRGPKFHKADFVHPVSERVVEFQSSLVDREIIDERESFYGESLVWIFNAIKSNIVIKPCRRKGFVFGTHTGGTDYYWSTERETYLDIHRRRLIKVTEWRSKTTFIGEWVALPDLDKELFKECLIKDADMRYDLPY